MKKIIFFCLTTVAIFSTTAYGQIPIVYYDFETNTHADIQTTVDLSASYSNDANGGTNGTVGNGASISVINSLGASMSVTNSLGASTGEGNGATYGGIAGVALGYTGFAVGTTSSSSDQAIIFSNFNCTGFNNLSVSFDAKNIGLGPANVDVYWSTDGITYTKSTFITNAVTGSFSNINFILQTGANSAAALYIKIIGYNGGVGTLRIDNFMLNASSYANNNTTDNELMTLPSAKSIGTNMSSGGNYFPTYNNFTINADPSNLLISRSIKFNGTLTLTNGNFQVNNSNTSVDSLIFIDSNIPIVSGAGTLGLNARSSLKFGDVGHTVGNAFTIPNSIFSNTSIGTLSINRDNGLILGDQALILTANVSPAITGNLNLITGIFNDDGNVVTVQGNITGAGSHVSTASGKIVMTGSGGKILPGLIYGNIEFNNAGGFSFTGSPTINGTLTLTNGAVAVGGNTLTFQTGNTPISTTAGTLTTTSNSNLVFGTTGNTGGTAFTIPDNTFTTAPDFNNLTINRTNPLTLNNQNTALRGKLTLTSGTLLLPSNYTFTLKSTSITNTALVDVVGANANIGYATGANFVVERFIPQGKRAYRFLSPSVNSGSATFFSTWQESGDTTSIYGTQITGKVGTPNATDATTGLDMTQTGASSLYTYNIVTGNYDAYTHTNQSTDTLSVLKGYLAIIKGNRHHNLGTDVATTNADVILRSKGALAVGNVSMSNTASIVNGILNSNIKLSSDPFGGTLIGNPYAAPIVWDSLVNRSTGLENNYYSYDPTINTSGAYVTYNVNGISNNGASNVNKFIQPGQSFFVANYNNSSPTLLITETHKAAASTNLTAIFGDNNIPISKIIFGINKLVNGNYINADGATAYFNNNFSNSSGREDATKFSNYPNEDIGINNNNDILSIDGRKIPTIADTISLNIKQFKANINYQLKIDLTSFLANGLQAFVIDKFSNTRTMLIMGSNNNYPFVTSSNAQSFNNRFYIVYQQTVLPMDFINVKAYHTNGSIIVDWITQESNINFYNVEYSTNGQTFIKIATIKATGASLSSLQNYKYNHTASQNGTNYYRIKSVDISGSIKYSSVVSVAISNTTITSITVYPNPIKNDKITVQFNNINKGTYNISVINMLGQTTYSTVQYHNGGSSSYQLMLPKSITKGTYQLNIENDTFKKTEKVLIE